MTITGTNFAAGATVTFGGTAATNVVVVNSTTITATTPAGSAGAVTVTVTNVGGQSGSLTNGFTYVVTADGEQCESPNSGPTAGGTAVTITGTNFAAGATVTFGSDGGDQCGGGEQHDDHGDDAGRQCGCGDGDGDRQRAEWEPDQWVHLRWSADGEQRVARTAVRRRAGRR